MNIETRIKLQALISIVLFASTINNLVEAQSSTNEQLWTEFYLNYSFANVYNLENRFRYRTNFESPKWRAFDFIPTLGRSFTQNIDGSFGITFSYVFQNDTANTFEVRPTLGTRIHFTPNRRILSRLLIRLEQRNFQHKETSDWEQSARLRIRPELLIPLNRKSYFEDKMVYAIIDAEWFIIMDKDVDERFANRFRLRTGLGYRLSRRWRFEAMFMLQESKNKIGEDFYSSDNIFRLRAKYYITHKLKQSKSVDHDR